MVGQRLKLLSKRKSVWLFPFTTGRARDTRKQLVAKWILHIRAAKHPNKLVCRGSEACHSFGGRLPVECSVFQFPSGAPSFKSVGQTFAREALSGISESVSAIPVVA